MIPFDQLLLLATENTPPPDPWWPESLSGMIGGLGGGAAGIWGAAFGITVGMLVPKGKGRLAIRVMLYPVAVFGLAALITGIVGWQAEQPRGVWYPLVLIGGILVVQLAWLIPFLEFTLRKVERKKLEAEELRRS